MAGLWQAPQLPLITLVVLVAVSDQFKRRTFFSVTEMTAVNEFVPETLYFLNDEYNRHSKDVYSFRILRVLQVQMWVTDHMEFSVRVEMRRTTCLKPKFSTCAPQKGKQYKQIHCYFLVYVNPWAEKFKTLKQRCEEDRPVPVATTAPLVALSPLSVTTTPFPVAPASEDPRSPRSRQ